MKVYSIDKNGYINSIKDVGVKYKLQENDIQGEPLFGINHHYETGELKPKTQEELKNDEIAELNNWLDLRRNIDHPDKATKQARLLELLG